MPRACASSRTHYEVTVEHFLVKALEDPQSDLPLILQAFRDRPRPPQQGPDRRPGRFQDRQRGPPGVFARPLIELFQEAWLMASIDLGETRIRSGAVLLAYLAKPTFFGVGLYTDLLKTIGREALLKDFWTIVKGSSEQKAAAAAGEGAPSGEAAPRGDGFIGRFCQDFTQRARERRHRPGFRPRPRNA